jgi:hypothetical protein
MTCWAEGIEDVSDPGRNGSQHGSQPRERLPSLPDHSDQADGDHIGSQTDLDEAQHNTGAYGSEGWGFESLRARQVTAG